MAELSDEASEIIMEVLDVRISVGVCAASLGIMIAFCCLAMLMSPTARTSMSTVARADMQWSRRSEPKMDSAMIQTLERALDVDQSNADILWRLARAYWWKAVRGTTDKASKLELLEKGRITGERAAALDPANAEAHHWHAVCIAQSGQLRGILQSLFMVKPTLEALDRALVADPNHARTHYFLAELLHQLPGPPLSIGNRQRAVEEARLAVKLDPSPSSHHLVLGKALAASKNYAEAREAFNYVLTMKPDSEDPEGFRRDQEEARSQLRAIQGK